jgi:predicted ATPase
MENDYKVVYLPTRINYESNKYLIRIRKVEKWNDFRFKTHAICNIITDVGIDYEFPIKIAISTLMMDSKIESELNFEKFSGLGNVLEATSNVNKEFELSGGMIFFSMLNSLEDYKDIISTFGVKETQRILKSLNDVVYLNEYSTATKNERSAHYLQEFLDCSAFNLSFIRNSEGYFAYRNAGDIVRGLENEVLDYISNELNLSFKLDGFANEHLLNLKYDSKGVIPKRINILIGQNGLGKSQTINHFIKAAANIKSDNFKMTDPQNDSGRPLINRIRAFVMPGEVAGTYPNQHANLKIDYKKIYVGKVGAQQERQLKDALISLVRNLQLIGNRSMFDLFCESLDNVIPFENIYISLKDSTNIPLWKLDGALGEEHTLRTWERIVDDLNPMIKKNEQYHPMSSGQLVFFKFALLALSNIANGTFVLIDEPETHLHPNFISGFISLLDDILERTGSLALIATHSPYLVREVTREQVHVFKIIDGNISIFKPRLKTFGANVSDISDFVFEDNIKNNLSEKLISNAFKLNRSYEEMKDVFFDELPVEMLHHVKDKLSKGDI